MECFIADNFVDDNWTRKLHEFVGKHISESEWDSDDDRLVLWMDDAETLSEFLTTELKHKITESLCIPFRLSSRSQTGVLIMEDGHPGLPVHTDFNGKDEWVCLIYFDSTWRQEFGGRFVVWEKDRTGMLDARRIDPLSGRLVAIKSSVKHSVERTENNWVRMAFSFVLEVA